MSEPQKEHQHIHRLVIFGATGDLAARMLLPSLYFLDLDGHLPADLRIVGSARRDMDRDAFVAYVRGVLDKRSEGVKADVWDRFAARIDYVAADVTNGAGLKALADHLGG